MGYSAAAAFNSANRSLKSEFVFTQFLVGEALEENLPNEGHALSSGQMRTIRWHGVSVSETKHLNRRRAPSDFRSLGALRLV